MRLPDSLKDFFHLNSRERNGLIILMAILLGVAIFYFLMPRFYATDGEAVTAEELDEVRTFLASTERKSDVAKYSDKGDRNVNFEPFEFDPNELSKEDWTKLGLTEKQAALVKKYEASGGHFEVKSDVLKLYPVDSALYEKLKPFILLPDEKAGQNWGDDSEGVVFEPFDFDPNGLPVEDWMKLGLTKKQAETIHRFESSGGHFEVKSDVLNLWQIDEELYHKLRPYIQLPDEKKKGNNDSEEVVFEPFEFDPNGLSVEDWMKLGLTERQAETIKKYEASGGHFEVKRDVLNLWQIDKEHYEKLKPYILLPNSFESDFDRYREKAELVKVELNTTDTVALKKVRGIGGFYAREIVEYREKLGGFYSLDQLREIYNVDDEKIERWESQLTIDFSKVEKMNINTAPAEELRNHPYLDWKHANAIVSYREQHGVFNTISGIRKIAIIDNARFEKLKPYLAIDK